MSILPVIPTTDVSGSQHTSPFAVKRIICIARNYADHAREMGHNPNKEPPFYFFKPITALDLSPQFILPSYSNNVQYELELVVALKHGGKQLHVSDAKKCVGGFGLGLDMTCRDLQKSAKEAGRPWEQSKGFDGSARCSTLVTGAMDTINRFGKMSLTHTQAHNQTSTLAQQGHWREMIWSVPELISHASQYITLIEGDLIYTGTPAGVGPVSAGDTLVAQMEGFPHKLHTEVTTET